MIARLMAYSVCRVRSSAGLHPGRRPSILSDTIMRKSKAKVGRPATVKNGHKLAVRLPADLIRRVEVYAARNKVDRSTAVRELLERGLKGAV